MTLQAANAARAKAAYKHKIAEYVKTHYAETKRGLCQKDIMAALGVCKNTVNRGVSELQREGRIIYIGLAGDTDREELAPNMRLYGPPGATVIPHGIAKAKPAQHRPYEGKPAVVARKLTPRTGSGQKGSVYVPEFKPLTPAAYDWRDVAAMRMLIRG